MVRRRGASFEVRVYLGVDAQGRKRYRSETVRGSEDDARRRCAALLDELDAAPADVERAGGTVGGLLEEWFVFARPGWSGRTVLVTRSIIDDYVAPGIGSMRLDRLRTSDVDKFYARLLGAGGKTGGPLSAATVRRVHGVLRTALTVGVRWGRLAKNPAADASPPMVQSRMVSPPSRVEVQRLLDVASGYDADVAVLFAFMAQTGARRSEALAIRWADLDVEQCFVVIRHAVTHTDRGLVVHDPKGHRVRRVALAAVLVARLVAYRSVCVQRGAGCGVVLGADGFVFAGCVDGRVPRRPDSVTRAFRVCARRAGLDGARLHDLRHFAATELLGAGVDVRTVAGRLGHRDASTTLNVYGHFVPARDVAAAALLGELLPMDSTRPLT